VRRFDLRWPEPGADVTRPLFRVACQREGTGPLPRAWDHLGGASSMTVDPVGRQSGAALAVGRSFQDERVCVPGEPVDG